MPGTRIRGRGVGGRGRRGAAAGRGRNTVPDPLVQANVSGKLDSQNVLRARVWARLWSELGYRFRLASMCCTSIHTL